MTIKDAEAQWMLQHQQNSQNLSPQSHILNRRNSVSNSAVNMSLFTSADTASDVTEYIDLNNGNKLAKPQYALNQTVNTSSNKSSRNNVTSPSNSSLDNDEAAQQNNNSRANSRSNSAISSYSRLNNHIANSYAANLQPTVNNKNPSNSTNNLNNTSKKSVALNNGANIIEDSTVMLFYGVKSLEIVDTKIEATVLNQINTISFHFIDYDEFLAKSFQRIRNKFPNIMVYYLI